MDSTPCLPCSQVSFERTEGFPLPLAICCCHSHIISGFFSLSMCTISNIWPSSALFHPTFDFFSPCPCVTPTIEVVTDDKQIHLSNSKCIVRFFLSLYSGYPQPEYRWMKDGSFQTEFSSEPVYKIQSIRREDAGVYQCVARNAVGSIFSEQVQVLVACTLEKYFRH